jgi:ATP-dependent Lon protease
LLKSSMKLHFVEEMDQVLQSALEEKLPELQEETPSALGAVLPPAIDTPQPVAHQ